MITVFYDGKCGLCRREIEHYKKIAPPEVFAWQDITIFSETFLRKGYSVKDGLKALHVEDHMGVMHTGVDAFVIIWQKLPRPWSLLPLLLSIPLIMPMTEKLYFAFAAWRFNKLGYDKCDL